MPKKVFGGETLHASRLALRAGMALLAACLLWVIQPKIVSHLAREHMATVILWLDSARNEARLADAYESSTKQSHVRATLEEEDAVRSASSSTNPWRLSVRATTSTQALDRLQAFITALRAEYNSRGPGSLRIAPDRHTAGLSTGTMRRTAWTLTFAAGALAGWGIALLSGALLLSTGRLTLPLGRRLAGGVMAAITGGGVMLWLARLH